MLRPGINVGSLAPAASPHQFWTVRAGERGRCRRPFERICAPSRPTNYFFPAGAPLDTDTINRLCRRPRSPIPDCRIYAFIRPSLLDKHSNELPVMKSPSRVPPLAVDELNSGSRPRRSRRSMPLRVASAPCSRTDDRVLGHTESKDDFVRGMP